MAQGSSFADFGDPVIDALTANLDAESHLPCDLDLFALEDEALAHSHDIFGLSLTPQTLPFPAREYLPAFFPEMPPDAPPTLGVTQSLFHPLQTSNEASTLQFRTTVTPPQNALLPHNGATGADLQFIGLTPWPSNVFPTYSLPTPSSPPVTALPPDWIKVPQRDYDHGRKQRNFERLAPIFFSVNGRPGINLGDALRKTSTGLDGRDDPVLQEATSTISCRLLFPGYPVNNLCQIHVLGWARNRLPITRGKLAHEIAKKVERYLTSVAGFPLDGSVDSRWRVGGGFMRIENMFLVRLVSVSKGSFQPEIWVADHSAPQVLVG